MTRLLALAALLVASCAHAAEDIVIADFEGDTYGDWKATGEAFGTGPARGTLPGQMHVSGFLGKGLVNSFRSGDRTIGTLTSPPLKLERPYINFLIGGGGHAGKTCMNLLLDGKVVRTSTGPNTHPGGSEELDWHSWDVKDLVGKSVVIQIVDDHTGGWGHINVDQIVQSDKPKKAGPTMREFTINKRYLHLPVKTGATMRRMKFVVDGQVVREFDIELSDDPGFYVYAVVGPWTGKKLTVEVNGGGKALEKIVAADDLPDAANLYREKLRPQFHFTSRRGWLNDPNGLVYHEGEWHLFYQHNPYGWNWGNMHWGHAVSKDLFHWQELGDAIYPPRHGDWAFSGSAFVFENKLAAAFTSTGRGECLTFSTDRGRTWKEPDGNPVVKHAGRDPKVIWHEPTKRWVMAVYDEFEKKQWIAFHSSADLKKWDFESRIEGFYECPDLFEIPVQGEKGASKWILYAADGKYVIGHFDGKKFTVESGKHQLWYGNFYAAQTFSNAPDGRRVQIGWGQSITFPGMPFNQQMTVPVELTLRRTKDGLRLFAEPVKELESIVAKDQKSRGELLDIRVVVTPLDGESLKLTTRGAPIVYDASKQELRCRHVTAPLPLLNGGIRLRVLVDHGSIEIFGNDGQVAMSVGGICGPAEESPSLEYKIGVPGPGRTTFEVLRLKSIWTESK